MSFQYLQDYDHAEDTINEALKAHGMPAKPCATALLHIHGNRPVAEVDRADHRYIYGADIPAIAQLEAEQPKLKAKIHPDYDYTLAEVVWAAKKEMAQTVEDVLARRVRLLYLDARAAIDSAHVVATTMAEAMGKDTAWADAQADAFINLAQGYLLIDYQPKQPSLSH